MWPLLFWPLLAAAQALSQGALLPAIRRTPPGPEADAQASALHGWGTVAYGLPMVLIPWLPLPWVAWVGAAFLSRALVFDPVLNKAAGRPVFEVGQTAWSDKLLRRIAPARPERLRAALWLLCVAAAVTLFFLNP